MAAVGPAPRLAADDASGAATTTPARRQHTEHGQERKQQLLDAASRLFADRGYDATRIEDICREAGVAKGLFYWYFRTKLDLYTELVRTMQRRLRQAQAAAIDPTTDGLTQLRQATAASVRFIAAHAPYFTFLDTERYGGLRDADLVREGAELAITDSVNFVRRAQAQGAIRDGDPRMLAIGVMGAVSSFSHAFRGGTLDVDPDELATFVADWLVRALEPR